MLQSDHDDGCRRVYRALGFVLADDAIGILCEIKSWSVRKIGCFKSSRGLRFTSRSKLGDDANGLFGVSFFDRCLGIF